MILKHKKIIIGGVIGVVTVGTLTGILVPILNKGSKTDAKELTGYEALVAQIVAAEDEQTAKDGTMELYGLDLKNDESIGALEVEKKKQYDAAVALGTYIHANKDKYKISVYEGKDDNDLKQLLLVFKLKTNAEESSSDAEDWPANKIDAEQDEFAFLHTILKDKFVHGVFSEGKQTTPPDGFVNDFKIKEYEKLQLYYAFKAASPSKDDFSSYNMAIDEDEYIEKKIRDYIIKLVNGISLNANDLSSNVQVTTDQDNVSGGEASGTITFKYDKLNDITKELKFAYIESYNLEILSGKNIKVADEVGEGDIKFRGDVPTNIKIASVAVSTKKIDGSTVEVSFASSDSGTTKPKLLNQDFGGFTSYRKKAFDSTIVGMILVDFDGIKTSNALASVYGKDGVLKIIKAKIMTILDAVAYKEKVRDSIGVDDITLVPDDINGSLTFTVTIGEDNKEFTVSGFLTQADADQADAVSVKTLIEAIKITKDASGDILAITENSVFDDTALKTLGIGTTFPTDIKDTTLTYTHSGRTSDGDLIINVKIKKRLAKETARFNVKVIGINKVKIQSKINNAAEITPTIQSEALIKTAKDVITTDLEITSVAGLQYKVEAVEKSTKTSDGTTVKVTIEISSIISGTKPRIYYSEVSGFMLEASKAEIDEAQPKIDNAPEIRPTIFNPVKFANKNQFNYHVMNQTARTILITDFKIFSPGNLKYEIIAVEKSSKTTDGTTVTITIKISSPVLGTNSRTYDIEFDGFVKDVRDDIIFGGENAIIDNAPEITPTIKSEARTKTANDVKINNFIMPKDEFTIFINKGSYFFSNTEKEATLKKYDIIAVKKSTKTSDGTTVTVTIKIHMPWQRIITPRTYDVEISGFSPE